jgi:hypothetical protein
MSSLEEGSDALSSFDLLVSPIVSTSTSPSVFKLSFTSVSRFLRGA